MKNEKKNHLEIWQIATFPQNLVLIRLMVSEKKFYRRRWRNSLNMMISGCFGHGAYLAYAAQMKNYGP